MTQSSSQSSYTLKGYRVKASLSFSTARDFVYLSLSSMNKKKPVKTDCDEMIARVTPRYYMSTSGRPGVYIPEGNEPIIYFFKVPEAESSTIDEGQRLFDTITEKLQDLEKTSENRIGRFRKGNGREL